MLQHECLWCKKQFWDMPSRVRRTCSKSCWWKYYLTGRKKSEKHKKNLRRADGWKKADKILTDYQRGDAILWLAKRYECDKRTIRNILKERGIKFFRGRAGITAWNKGKK